MPSKRILISSDLSQYVPFPAAGMYMFQERSYLGVNVTVEWYILDGTEGDELGTPATDMFLVGATYRAIITLKVKDTGPLYYYFDETEPFQYAEERVEEQRPLEDSELHPYERKIEVIFKPVWSKELQDQERALLVLEYNLQRYVPVPVDGASPEPYVEQPHFNISVVWTPPNITVFEEGETYQAEITLTTIGDYKFNEGFRFKYPEGTVADQSWEETDFDLFLRTVKVKYLETKKPEEIEEVNLSYYIPKPAIGATPVLSFSGGAWTGIVNWPEPGSGEIFKPETSYTAVVTLSTAAGYIFSDDFQVQYSNPEVTVESFTGTGNATRMGNINFPTTGSPVVDDLDLTPYISVPVFGKLPEGIPGERESVIHYTIEPLRAQYLIDIIWDPTVPDDGFSFFDEYTAMVTLKAKPAYTFKEMKGEFSHTGAKKVDPTGADGTMFSLNIEFPRTVIDLRFSGLREKKDSVIDLIREEKASKDPLILTLKPTVNPTVLEDVLIGPEWDLGYDPADSSKKGLVLDSTNSPAVVTIDGKDRVIALAKNGDAALITVKSGVTLTLENITFRGVKGNSAPLIIVDGGELILGNGVEISDNTIEEGQGGAIPGGVWVKDGTLTMNPGAIITHNQGVNGGGGVVIESGGVFTTRNGEVKENVSKGSGAPYTTSDIFEKP